MPKSKKSDTEKPKKADKPAKEKKATSKKAVAPKAEKAPKAPKAEKPAKTKAPKAAVKPAIPKVKKTVATPTISLDDISLRAYFIAERRQAMGWPGDSTSDWVEAERQLKAEAAKKAKS